MSQVCLLQQFRPAMIWRSTMFPSYSLFGLKSLATLDFLPGVLRAMFISYRDCVDYSKVIHIHIGYGSPIQLSIQKMRIGDEPLHNKYQPGYVHSHNKSIDSISLFESTYEKFSLFKS